MKNHIPLFLLCGALFFASCDDSTTKNGENEEAVYYEASFHMYALENETEDTQNQLSQTEQEIEQNCKGEQDMSEICQQLRKRRDSLKLLIDNKQNQIELLANRLAKVDPPVPQLPPDGDPIPPSPNPCPVGNCLDLSKINAIYVNKNLKDFNLRILNAHGELVGGLGKALKTDTHPEFTKHLLEIDATGSLIMKVDKYSPILGMDVGYEIQGFISEKAKEE